MKFKTLFQGPQLDDGAAWVDETTRGVSYHRSCRWSSTGLFALDFEDQPWTLAWNESIRKLKWLRIDEMIAGAQ